MKKRIISMFLILSMVLVLLPMNTFAATSVSSVLPGGVTKVDIDWVMIVLPLPLPHTVSIYVSHEDFCSPNADYRHIIGTILLGAVPVAGAILSAIAGLGIPEIGRRCANGGNHGVIIDIPFLGAAPSPFSIPGVRAQSAPPAQTSLPIGADVDIFAAIRKEVRFTAPYAGRYRFESSNNGTTDPKAYHNQTGSNFYDDDSAGNRNYRFDRDLSAGETFSYYTGIYNEAFVGLPGSINTSSHKVNISCIIIYTDPSAPLNLRATLGNGQIALSWSAPLNSGGIDITRYEVSHGGDYWVNASSSTGHTFTNLTNGNNYTVSVRAINAVNRVGEQSSLSNLIPGAPPSAPLNFTAEPGDSHIILTWSAPQDTGGLTISRYEVSIGSTWEPASSNNMHVFDGLTNGISYTVKVRAFNREGPGAEASLGSVVPRSVPSAPEGLSAIPGNSQITIVWNEPYNGGSTITEYGVSFGTSTWETASSSNMHVFRNLENGFPYTVRVRAKNAEGWGEHASLDNIIPRTIPSAPLDLSAIPGDGKITLSWNPPESDGGSAITGYVVSSNGGNTWENALSDMEHIFHELTNGISYTVMVSAVNIAGQGPVAFIESVIPVSSATYSVTVNSDGIGATGNGTYAQDETVDINAGISPTGLLFKNWTASPSVIFADPNSDATSFKMPASSVTVTANFEFILGDAQIVILDRQGGVTGATSFTATLNSETLTNYTAPTRDGYSFDGYYTASTGGSRAIDTSDRFVANVSDYTNAIGQWIRTSTPTTLFARWTPNINAVTVSPNPVIVLRSTTQQFSATVDGLDSAPRGVTWSVIGESLSGGTTISTDGLLTVAADESSISLTVRATSIHTREVFGTATVTVPPLFVPVTNIAGIPTTATSGTPLILTGTIVPASATNRAIIWSIQNAGTTGATITGSTLHTTAAGIVRVLATITNGLTETTNYSQEFSIVISSVGNPPPPPIPPPTQPQTTPTPTPPTMGMPEIIVPISPFNESFNGSFNDSFEDVASGAWYYNDVKYVARNGLMNGTSTSPMLFSPSLSTTRGMIVTILYRLSGSPDASALPNPFDDVAAGAWYFDAVKWAAENGIVSGYGGGKFGPADDITREQLATILNNYAIFAGLNLPTKKEYQAFADDANIAEYAKGAVERLFKAGVVGGKQDNSFDPKGNATRAEVASMLTRFISAREA